MTKSIYASIAEIKQNKYDKLLVEISQKSQYIDTLIKEREILDQELDELKKNLPSRKSKIYEEHFSSNVNRNTFEMIGYKIMALEHEISAHKIKIKTKDEEIEAAKTELAELNVKRKEFSKIIEKYNILIELDIENEKRLEEFTENNELEEFSKAMPRE